MSRFAQIAGFCLSALAAASAAQGSRSAASREAVPLGELKDFDGISAGGPDSLVISRSDRFSVQVEGDPATVAQLDIYVEDHVLHVERHWRGEGSRHRAEPATVRVMMPELRHVSLRGSGDLRADAMSGAQVDVSLAGSGDISIIDMTAQEARLSLAGSGRIKVGGTVTGTRVSLAGSGDVDADQLSARWSEIALAGSGDARVHASEGAQVSIVGSGDVMIRGTTNCRTSRTGSGDVHCSV